MASTITDKKFGVVHTSPSKLVANAASLEEGKLYFASGDANGVVKQGIYGIVGVTTEGHIDEYNVAMFGTGAVADGIGYGLSQYNFDGDASTKLKNLHDASVNYLLKTNYVQVDKDSSGWVPMADGSAGTIDSQTGDWVLAFDGTKVDWFKLPENAFKNDNSIYSGVAPISVTNGQISHANSGITAGRYGDSGDARALNFGDAFKVVDVSVNAFGHVTDISVKELTLPAKPSTAGTADKVAQSLTIKGGGTIVKSFDGASAVTIDIKSGDSSTLTITGTADGSIKITPVTGDVNSTSNKLTTGAQVATYVSNQLGNLSGALVYKGTISSYANLPSDASAGWVYIASAKFTTTAAQTGAAYAIEIGDMFIYNGASWNIVSSEFDVSANNPTLEWGKQATIATVDGVDLKVTLPVNPNTDTKNTAGSSNKVATKLLLVGATSTTTGETFTNANVYINTSNQIVATSGAVAANNLALVNGGTVYTAIENAKTAATAAATIYWETL